MFSSRDGAVKCELMAIIINRWVIWLFTFLKNTNYSDLKASRLQKHIEAHISILERSAFNFISESRGLSTSI